MVRELICIVCPQGCHIEARVEGEELVAVSGNRCPRGEGYAREEIFHPMRTLTTTVRVRGGVYPVVPVKTAQPIPKERLLQAMAEVREIVVDVPVMAGDVLIADVAGTGVEVVATRVEM